MLNNGEKFRCHFSMIFERTITLFILFVFWIFQSFLDEDSINDTMKMIKQLKSGNIRDNDDFFGVIVGLGIVLIVSIIIFVFNWISWAKTYISVVDNTLIWEKNTINKKKKTIAVQNISNINTEQNIFEMIMGTCKVKLDTNSKSTSDTTDFKIVLKKKKAEEFKKMIMGLMRDVEVANLEKISSNIEGLEEKNVAINRQAIDEKYEMFDENGDYDVTTTMKEIIYHGIYSINIFSFIISIVALVISVGGIRFAISNGGFGSGLLTSFMSIAVTVVVCISTFWSIVQGFLKYYGFRVKRHGDKIYMQYGFFKKINYTIPVDKINSVFIKQSAIARFYKKYCVDIVNIGMGDENAEEDTCLLIYGDAFTIQNNMKKILPEFTMESGLNYEPQPKKCIWKKISDVVFLSLAIMIVAVIAYYFNKTVSAVTMGIAGLVLAIYIPRAIISIKSEGITLENEHLKVVTGIIGRTFQWVEYKKIQYIEYDQNIIMKRMKFTDATIHILASSTESQLNLPYMKDESGEKLRRKVLGE